MFLGQKSRKQCERWIEGTAESDSGLGRGAPTQDVAKAEEMDLRGYIGDG